MIIQQIIETGIDITELQNCTKQMTMVILNQKYKNKNFMGINILSIDEILRMSPAVVCRHGRGDVFTRSVEFLVTGIKIKIGDIYAGVEIVKLNALTLICKSENTDIVLNTDTLYKSFSLGYKVPIVVTNCIYRIMEKRISVAGVALQGHNLDNATCFIVNQNLKLNNYLLENYNICIDQIAKLKATKLELFNFYASHLYKFPIGDSVGDLTKLNGSYFVDLRTNGFVEHEIPLKENEKKKVINDDNLNQLIWCYCNQTKYILDSIEIYNSKEMMEKHKLLFIALR